MSAAKRGGVSQFVPCPVCGRVQLTFKLRGRMVYVVHGPRVPEGDQCEASGWLVEDEDYEAVR